MDKQRRKIWLSKLHRADWNPSKHALVCSDHFNKSDFECGGKFVRVKRSAVPTLLNLNFEEQIYSVSHDHSYVTGDTEGVVQNHNCENCEEIDCEDCVINEEIINSNQVETDEVSQKPLPIPKESYYIQLEYPIIL